MSKLAINNIGPIKEGLGESKYIDFDRLTIFIGTQGSGKSTIAKVFSSLCWLEKSITRGDLTRAVVEKSNYFVDHVMSFQGISGYFTKSSYLHFVGEKCEFKLVNSKFTVKLVEDGHYASPKIMYVPAERNFLTSIARPDLISKLPRALHAFLAEYEEAKSHTQTKIIDLPVGGLKYEHDPKDNTSYLIGDGFRTDLINGSSGYQSLVPLFLVTEYLSKFISQKDKSENNEEFLNVALQRRMSKELKRILSEAAKDGTEKDGTEKILGSIWEKLEVLQRRFFYSSFVNIVEEPEQNLYPDSQQKVLFELFKALNSTSENKLLITTHSPYVINFTTLNIEAFRIYQTNLSDSNKKKLEKIVPENSALNPRFVKVYELEGNGAIKHLKLENGLIPDNNKLNSKLGEINDLFSLLLDLEG